MKKTVAAAALCAAALLFAACTPTTSDGDASGTSEPPAPAPTVTVTVTASPAPEPEESPFADEAYATPTMSSADAIDECLDAHERSGFTSEITGEKYAFLMHDGGWWVVLEGENEHGTLHGECVVGGDRSDGDDEVGYGESAVENFSPGLVDLVVHGKGGL